MTEASRGAQSRQSLVDVRGLGKPPSFDNQEKNYVVWSRKVESYVGSIFPTCRAVLAWSSEQQSPVKIDDVYLEFASVSNPILAEFNEQMYSCLMALTFDESFDITVGAGAGEGIEAWRRLAKRWDPLTAGRARSLLRDILAPQRVKLPELQAALERLEEQMRRYTGRRDASGAYHTLAEDIKMSSVEALLPEDLEKHVQMNRQRLNDYASLREEIVMYAEARGTSIQRKKDPNAMDVDTNSLAYRGGHGKGGKHGGYGGAGAGKGGKGGKADSTKGAGGKGDMGKGKGKELRECWHCGKPGHLSSNCWSKIGHDGKGGKAKGDGKGGKSGKGKGGKGKGRDANALDQSGEPEAEKDVGSFDLNAFDRSINNFEKPDESGWLKINLDTGAAASVWPSGIKYGKHIGGSGETIPSFRTATGECVPGEEHLRVQGAGEWGQTLGFQGWTTGVRKPLVAAGEVTAKDNIVLLDGQGGHVIGNKFLKEQIRWAVKNALEWDHSNVVPVHKEKGIYNMYLKVKGNKTDTIKETCPYDDEQQNDADMPPSSSGGPRRGKTL